MIIVFFYRTYREKIVDLMHLKHTQYIFFIYNEFRKTRNSLVIIISMTIMTKKSEMNIPLFSKNLVHT